MAAVGSRRRAFPQLKNCAGSSDGEVIVDHMHEINVHGFEHYLRYPRVVGSIAQSIVGMNLVPDTAIDDADRHGLGA